MSPDESRRLRSAVRQELGLDPGHVHAARSQRRPKQWFARALPALAAAASLVAVIAIAVNLTGGGLDEDEAAATTAAAQAAPTTAAPATTAVRLHGRRCRSGHDRRHGRGTDDRGSAGGSGHAPPMLRTPWKKPRPQWRKSEAFAEEEAVDLRADNDHHGHDPGDGRNRGDGHDGALRG